MWVYYAIHSILCMSEIVQNKIIKNVNFLINKKIANKNKQKKLLTFARFISKAKTSK